ncbi:hypothetical protein CFP65_4346 [Kitasatospora sp. MMS16-BH015]|uniref:DUF3180 domain-containing protein n=1 Tax=Kitasatospora sp. MMS16-BH015 TaxID=2018025 RepID=UPI000CA3A01A|nr:DUF3180 domain-containing protein [Kitasatospora sp. MMS16-BH015]AUG79096.1 hypothetical protein CFP65_4346 [Kitasatospora sp. MMS16-BH015]
MKPLRLRLLLGIAAVAGVLAWAGAKLWDSVGQLPGVPTAAPIVLAVVAVVLLATAISLRARLKAARERRPGAKAVDPLSAARAVVLAQASALVAAVATGIYAGAGVYLLGLLDIAARKSQAITAGFAVLTGAAVVAAALWLQHVCKLPEDHNDPTPGPAPSAR